MDFSIWKTIAARCRDFLRRKSTTDNTNNRFWLSFSIFVLLIMLVAIIPIAWQNNKLKDKLAELQAEIDHLQKQNAHYSKQIEALQQDPLYVEFLLRKKLHYGRKNEKVIFDGRKYGGNR